MTKRKGGALFTEFAPGQFAVEGDKATVGGRVWRFRKGRWVDPGDPAAEPPPELRLRDGDDWMPSCSEKHAFGGIR